jgi:membrane protein required for colicin V production
MGAVNWIDLAVLAIIVISALLAFLRGFVREALGIGAWVGAGVVAWWAFPWSQPQARALITGYPELADFAAYVAVFVVALILLSIVAGMVGGLVRTSLLSGIDRTLGIVFGLARGAAIVVAGYIALSMVVPPDRWPPPLAEARSPLYAYEGAMWAVRFLPEAYRPSIKPPPSGVQARAEDLFQSQPRGSALDPVGSAQASPVAKP